MGESDSLLCWVSMLIGHLGKHVFSRRPPECLVTLEDFKNGELISKILKEVIDPDFFLSLKSSPQDCSPLVDVIKEMKSYFLQQVGHAVPVALTPNIRGLMVSPVSPSEVRRLLQLLLGCAVNSPRREEFVNNIRLNMESHVQTELMKNIQELMEPRGTSELINAMPKASIDEQLQKLVESEEKLNQKVHELNSQISELTLEKGALLAENEKLISQFNDKNLDPESMQFYNKINEEHKKEIEQLRERCYELEGVVEDSKIKNEQLEKHLIETRMKLNVVSTAESECVRLKDEMDSLREALSKSSHYENQVKTLQKKLEQLSDVNRNIKLLEEKNEELIKENLKLCDESKKQENLLNKIEGLKKDLADTQERLSQETEKALKSNFECEKIREKLEIAESRIKSECEEKSKLLELLDEFKDCKNTVPGTATSSTDSFGLLPVPYRERMIHLEHENEKLRNEKLFNQEEGSKVLIEKLRNREAELDRQLIAKCDEIEKLKAHFKKKIASLEDINAANEMELRKKQSQYEKNMEKAKNVIMALEPTSSPTPTSDKNDVKIKTLESKLLQNVFYNYSGALSRASTEQRNNATSATLLQRHRQSHHQNLFKTGYNYK